MTRPPPKDSHAHRSRNVSSHRDTTGFPKRTMTHSNYTYATSHTHTRSSSSSTSWLNRSVEWQSGQCLVFSILEGPKSVNNNPQQSAHRLQTLPQPVRMLILSATVGLNVPWQQQVQCAHRSLSERDPPLINRCLPSFLALACISTSSHNYCKQP